MIKQVEYEDIEFSPATSEWCKNGSHCPNYGNNWSCPPESPYMEKKLMRYDQFFLLIFEFDISHLPVTKVKKVPNPRHYNGSIRKGLANLIDEFILNNIRTEDFLVLAGGGCRICKNKRYGGCAREVGKPCRFPDRMHYSMESVGIDVDETLRKIGIELQWPPKTVARQVGLVCVKDNGRIRGLGKWI